MPQPKDHAAQANADRSEDLAWMADWHETLDGAARRLGMSVKSLAIWCRRNDPEVLVRLQENAARRKVAS